MLIDDRLKEVYITVLMEKLVNLHDEVLKKENTETMGSLINVIGTIYNNSSLVNKNQNRFQEPFYQFWFKMILKFMNSSSLVVKLFGWEQLNDLIVDIKSIRPLAGSFTVEGAGTDFANGVYVASTSKNPDADHLQYSKVANQQGVPLLTLFRCTMRNTKAKWWFISQADLEKPGTDKDIDYYLQKSSHDDEREPPSLGWTRNNSGMNLVGGEPAPTLKRSNIILPKGFTKEMCIDYKFIEWCTAHDLLTLAFSSSVHRETVARSMKYLQFLAEYDSLTADALKLIWKAGMQTNETDVMEEIFSIIVHLSPLFSSEIFCYLVELALDCLKIDELSPKVMRFVEKFSTDDFRYMNAIHNPVSQSKFFGLLWLLYLRPPSTTATEGENMKSAMIIQDLLSSCFKSKSGKEIALEKIRESIMELNAVKNTFSMSDSEGRDEGIPSRIIQTLYFLISKFQGGPNFVDNLKSFNFVEIIVNEIVRFIEMNRFQLNSDNEKWYLSQLSNRFQVLRKYYVISNCDDLEIISSLWTLTQEKPQELDEFFKFLRGESVSQSTNSIEHIFSNMNVLVVFKTIICNDYVNWSQCGENAFDCFRIYSNELELWANVFPDGTELPPRLGLQTLWNIVLNIRNERVQHEATELLLQGFDLLISRSSSGLSVQNEFLKVIFDHLQIYSENLSASPKPTSADLKILSQKAERCVSVLTAALRKFGNGSNISHAARSTMSRMTLNVYYRRVSYHYNPTTQLDSLRIDKGSDGMVKVEIHPFHTIKLLKQKICESLRNVSLNSITIDNQFHHKNFNDFTHLFELGIVDGQEISVSYQFSYNQYQSSNQHFHNNAMGKNPYDDDYYGGAYNSNRLTNSNNPRVDHPSDSADANQITELSFGQLVCEDFSKFDVLLSICQVNAVEDSDGITSRIWELLMLLPTQPDLMDMIQRTTNSIDDGLIHQPHDTNEWQQIFDTSSFTRKAYLLQIIDSFLTPAPEVDYPKVVIDTFRTNFLKSGGLNIVLTLFLSTPTNSGNIISFTSLAVCLHALYYLIFEQVTTTTSISEVPESDSNASSPRTITSTNVTTVINEDCMKYLTTTLDENQTSKLIEKLLYVAHNAAMKENSSAVHSALVIITLLIKSPTTASILINNSYTKSLLTNVLRSPAKKVREIACDFAVQVGRIQNVVFNWLLEELELISYDDQLCSDIFHALNILLLENKSRNNEQDQKDREKLASLLSVKLLQYPKQNPCISEERFTLVGYLQLMVVLIEIDVNLILNSAFGEKIIPVLLNEFLFVLNENDEDNVNDEFENRATALCDTALTRRLAFQVLTYLSKYSKKSFMEILNELMKYSKQASRHMHYYWGLQVSHEIKKPDMKYTGLKNQGCTCYSNSVLQMLFMTPKFREAILATPIRECHRTTVWHRKPEELVGMSLLFECSNGSWKLGHVVEYDPEILFHKVNYIRTDATIEETAFFNIHDGRVGRETGRVRVMPADNLPMPEPLQEKEEGAYRVLEQLQRTFCFLKLTKRKYFDPRPLVEVCKTLNLNFNVYHQNDATEFYDQLLDRIETATKGKYTKKNMWNDIFAKDIFGGKWVTQKIPQDCDYFRKDKDTCGHWQSTRVEDYLKVELIVRGKEKIDDSLEGLVQGELMDGDNKIGCEVCHEKKATTRRTCFGSLPNTLMLHLKRFDLDFQTFETVKLNTKMTFPMGINMLKYTKEGIEIAEQEKEKNTPIQSQNSSNREPAVAVHKELTYQFDSSQINSCDFEYKLQGVLVHAGVAQGGHYYAFIRGSDNDDKSKWYRFDDDDVTPFSPEHIPFQCFGGPAGNTPTNSNSHHIEEDRTANALMLFYSKVNKESTEHYGIPPSESLEQLNLTSEPPPSDLVDGLHAFKREVLQSNLQHLLTCYLVDPELHNFVRILISAVSGMPLPPSEDASRHGMSNAAAEFPLQWDITDKNLDLPLQIVQFSCEFLLNVVLHCRERPAVRSSLNVMKGIFEKYPHTAYWFVYEILFGSHISWFNDYVLSCTDTLARASFVQLVVFAVTVIAPVEENGLIPHLQMNSNELKKEFADSNHKPNPGGLCAFVVRILMEYTVKAVNYVRTADELFVLIRDLAAIPSVCRALKHNGNISFLCYFIMPENVPPLIRGFFEKAAAKQQSQQQQQGQQNYRMEFGHLLQSVFEAIAAILGVPQTRKVNLLHEKTYWDSELVPEAKEAFSLIFAESSRNNLMELNDIIGYIDRVTNTNNQRNNSVLARSMLDRFGSHLDNKLYLDGFLQYQADVASYNPKQVWRVKSFIVLLVSRIKYLMTFFSFFHIF
jgi:ubiquitin C-terminal hydrolase